MDVNGFLDRLQEEPDLLVSVGGRTPISSANSQPGLGPSNMEAESVPVSQQRGTTPAFPAEVIKSGHEFNAVVASARGEENELEVGTAEIAAGIRPSHLTSALQPPPAYDYSTRHTSQLGRHPSSSTNSYF
jgi:hypothetical protein